jgi:hypothetical protein
MSIVRSRPPPLEFLALIVLNKQFRCGFLSFVFGSSKRFFSKKCCKNKICQSDQKPKLFIRPQFNAEILVLLRKRNLVIQYHQVTLSSVYGNLVSKNALAWLTQVIS